MQKKTTSVVRLLTLCIGLVLALPSAWGSTTKAELDQRVVKAQELLSLIMGTPATTIPTPVLAQAKAIVFVERFQGGVIIGIKGGSGVAMLHDGNGNWSPPAFYKMGGGSFGLQFGGEVRRSIWLIMNDEGTRLLTGEVGEFSLDMSIAAGPSGKNADYSNVTETPIISYSLTSGIYAGATLQGGLLTPSSENNAIFYSQEGISPLDILESRVDMPAIAQPIADTLSNYVKDGFKRLR